MEGNVVFAYEMDVAASRVEPVLLPLAGFLVLLCPFFDRADVAEDCFHPDVDGLVLRAFERCGDAPGEVTGQRAGFQSISYPAQAEVSRVLREVRILLNVLFQLI